MTGIEPAFSAWEADVLPLNYTREGTAESRRETLAMAEPEIGMVLGAVGFEDIRVRFQCRRR